MNSFPFALALAVFSSVAAHAETLAEAVARAVDSRIATADPATTKPIFSTRNDAGKIYVRNPQCWAASIDLTPMVVWNSDQGNKIAGILVSPRHVVSAQHFQIADNVTVRFVTKDNQVVERKVISGKQVGTTDIHVSLLESAVPASISFARVLPLGYAATLPPVGLPVFATDQEKKALVADVMMTMSGLVYIAQPSNAQRKAFYEPWIVGDSGSAAALIVNNILTLMVTATDPDNGPDYSANQTALNSAMADLGGGYQLTVADLSGPKPTLQSGSVTIEPK